MGKVSKPGLAGCQELVLKYIYIDCSVALRALQAIAQNQGRGSPEKKWFSTKFM
jgi:hypothetical protein